MIIREEIMTGLTCDVLYVFGMIVARHLWESSQKCKGFLNWIVGAIGLKNCVRGKSRAAHGRARGINLSQFF